MKISQGILFVVLSFAAVVTACGNGSSSLPGAIYFKTADAGIERLDLSTGRVSTVMPYWTDAFSGTSWDISWDGTRGVKVKSPRAFHEDEGVRYTMFDTADGRTVRDVIYHPDEGDNGGMPNISPDGKYLALRPTLDDGLVILDMEGNILRNIRNMIGYLDPITWERGGTILFGRDGWLWRTSTDFRKAFKIQEIPSSEWKGNAAASPDGKKIAVPVGRHIWMMNADGSDFHAITESNQAEGMPSFSPDSRWLAIACNPRAASAANSEIEVYVIGTAPHLCIIPADGRVYNVEPGKDDRVMHPRPKGSPDSPVGMLVRDFVWRP
jgi:hypothetical protein